MTCAACGGDLRGDEDECPRCGIRIPRGPAPMPDGGFVPPLVPPGLAGPPLMPIPAGPDEPREEAPALHHRDEPSDDSARRPAAWWMPFFVVGGVALAVWAGINMIARRPDPPPAGVDRVLEDLEQEFCRLRIPADATRSHLTDDRAEAWQRQNPAAWKAAAARHAPLRAAAAPSLHGFFEAYLGRRAEPDPDWAAGLGLHPHPTTVTRQDDETEIALWLLDRDARTALQTWPAGGMTPHDKTDRQMFLTFVEWSACADASRRDQINLAWTLAWFDSFESLRTIDCCPRSDRAKAAAARLRDIARCIETISPGPLSHATADHAARRISSALPYLRELAGRWSLPKAQTPLRRELSAAADEAVEALARFKGRLSKAGSPKHDSHIGLGLANFRLILDREQSAAPEVLLYDTVKDFSAALREWRAGEGSRAPESGEGSPVLSDKDFETLARHIPEWVLPAPMSIPPVRCAPIPRIWQDEGADAFYFGPGPLSPPAPPWVLIGASANRPTPGARWHIAAHEVSPGHHLQAHLAADACRIRRALGSYFYVEGWANYAEELLHETDRCPERACRGAWNAGERMGLAFDAVLDIALHTGAAEPARVLAWMRAWSANPDLGDADLGAFASRPALPLAYWHGPRQIRALRDAVRAREGAAFDLRAFHGRLLRAGPVPPALLEREWLGR